VRSEQAKHEYFGIIQSGLKFEAEWLPLPMASFQTDSTSFFPALQTLSCFFQRLCLRLRTGEGGNNLGISSDTKK
jgi:hypothetical protein